MQQMSVRIETVDDDWWDHINKFPAVVSDCTLATANKRSDCNSYAVRER